MIQPVRRNWKIFGLLSQESLQIEGRGFEVWWWFYLLCVKFSLLRFEGDNGNIVVQRVAQEWCVQDIYSVAIYG